MTREKDSVLSFMKHMQLKGMLTVVTPDRKREILKVLLVYSMHLLK